MSVQFSGIVPYLFYDNAEAAMEWYARVFGFEDIGRWQNDEGKVQNGEMRVGNTEIWMDGGGRQLFPEEGDDRQQWIGVGVDDVDAMYALIKSAGVEAEPPVTREFGVQMLSVPDPFGYLWGFMRRLDAGD
jgi:uncharacterized glyoxalase superfamily protein PhnB